MYNDLNITSVKVSQYLNIQQIIYSRPFEKNGRTIVDHYIENIFGINREYIIIKELDNSYTFQISDLSKLDNSYIFQISDLSKYNHIINEEYKKIIIDKTTYQECKKQINEMLKLDYTPSHSNYNSSNKNFKSRLENEINNWCKGILNA